MKHIVFILDTVSASLVDSYSTRGAVDSSLCTCKNASLVSLLRHEPPLCSGHCLQSRACCKRVQKNTVSPRDHSPLFPSHTCFMNCRDCITRTSSNQSLTASSSSTSSSSLSVSEKTTSPVKSIIHHSASPFSSRGSIAIVIMQLITVLTLVMVALTLSRSTSQVTLHHDKSSALSSSPPTPLFAPLHNVSSGDGQRNHHHRRHHHSHSEHTPLSSTSRSHVKPTVKPLTGKSAFLRREMLKNTSVTCNDGTRAGYYVRYAANGSSKWLIYLEGGGHCFSRESCQQRWIRVRTLMTSAHWPMMRSSKSSLYCLHCLHCLYCLSPLILFST